MNGWKEKNTHTTSSRGCRKLLFRFNFFAFTRETGTKLIYFQIQAKTGKTVYGNNKTSTFFQKQCWMLLLFHLFENCSCCYMLCLYVFVSNERWFFFILRGSCYLLNNHHYCLAICVLYIHLCASQWFLSSNSRTFLPFRFFWQQSHTVQCIYAFYFKYTYMVYATHKYTRKKIILQYVSRVHAIFNEIISLQNIIITMFKKKWVFIIPRVFIQSFEVACIFLSFVFMIHCSTTNPFHIRIHKIKIHKKKTEVNCLVKLF